MILYTIVLYVFIRTNSTYHSRFIYKGQFFEIIHILFRPLAPGSTRPPGDIGPEYPVVRSFSLGTRPPTGAVVHREPPKKMHTQNVPQRNDVVKPANRFPGATRSAGEPIQKQPDKPTAANLYEDHMKKRQFVSHRFRTCVVGVLDRRFTHRAKGIGSESC